MTAAVAPLPFLSSRRNSACSPRASSCAPLAFDARQERVNSELELGKRCMENGDRTSAVEHFSAALAHRPGLVRVLYWRGLCLLSLGAAVEAQRDFQQVIASDGLRSMRREPKGLSDSGHCPQERLRDVYVLIALCLQRQGDYVAAIRHLNRCLGRHPGYVHAIVARGALYLKVKEFDKARLDFEVVLKGKASHLAARRGLGDALRSLGDFSAAYRQYTSALSCANRRLRRLENDGADAQEEDQVDEDYETLFREEDFDQPFEDRLTSASSRVRSSYEYESDDLQRSSAWSAAQDGFRGNWSLLGPRSPNASAFGLGNGTASVWASLRTDELLPLLEPMEGLAGLKTFVRQLRMRRAMLLRIAGDLEGAGADLLEVLEEDPCDGYALFWYAKVLVEQRRHKEAPAYLQGAAQHCGDLKGPALALLGSLLLVRPDPDCASAARMLADAVSITPQSQSIRITSGIFSAAAILSVSPRTREKAQEALVLLDHALVALGGASSVSPIVCTGGVPRVHVAGSGSAAVVAAKRSLLSAEELCWEHAKDLARNKRILAQGDDLEVALQCSTYLELVSRPSTKPSCIPPLLHTLRAVAACTLGLYDSAFLECRKGLEVDPDDEVLKYNYNLVFGVLRSQKQDYETAISNFSKLVRLRPVDPDARVHRAIALACRARSRDVMGARDADMVSGKALQLLEEAVQDLDAAEQQSAISGRVLVTGVKQLLAACLCGTSRFRDAWEVMEQWKGNDHHSVTSSRSSQAEVLMLNGRFQEAINICQIDTTVQLDESEMVWLRLISARCWSALGESEKCFALCREALLMRPEYVDVHKTCAELFMAHGLYLESVTALDAASRVEGLLGPRFVVLRALALLAMGNLKTAGSEFCHALRLNPNITIALHGRDAVAAMQLAFEGDYRHAHVKFNSLLHNSHNFTEQVDANGSTGGAPPIQVSYFFSPYELMLYRGVCALYMGETAAAAQDFEHAFTLARQLLAAEESSGCSQGLPNTGSASLGTTQRRLPDVLTLEGLERFECEMLYNVVICHLVGREYRSAIRTCEVLMRCRVLPSMGSKANALAWFMLGLCRLSLGEADNDEVREAFMKSFGSDPTYVNDFLNRHEPRVAMADSGGAHYRIGGPAAALALVPAMPRLPRPSGSKELRKFDTVRISSRVNQNHGVSRPGGHVVTSMMEVCPDEPVVCLRNDKLSFGARLPPRKIAIKDVVFWARPAAAWPFIAGVEGSLTRPTAFERLEMPRHEDIGINALLPWEF